MQMQMQDNLALATGLYATFYGLDTQAVDVVPLGLIRPFIALLRAPGGTTASALFATPRLRSKSGSSGNVVDQVASSSTSRVIALASDSASASISDFRSDEAGLEDSELWVTCKVCDPLSSGFPVTIPHPVHHVGQFPLAMLEHLRDKGHQTRSRGDQEIAMMVVDDRSASPSATIVESAFASGSPISGSVIDPRTPEPEDTPNIREQSIASGKRKRTSFSPEIRIIRHKRKSTTPDDGGQRYARACSLASDGSPPPARPVFPDEIIRNIVVPGPLTRPLAIDDAQDEWMDLLALDGDRQDVALNESGQPIPEFEHLRLEAIARAHAAIRESDGSASIALPEVDAETIDELPELTTPSDAVSDDGADVLIQKHAHITTVSQALAVLGLQGRDRTLAGVETPLRDSQVVAIANMRHYMKRPANPLKAGFFLCDAPGTGKTLVALTSLLNIAGELASGMTPTLILCRDGDIWRDELFLHLPHLKQYFQRIFTPSHFFEYEQLRKSGGRTAMILLMQFDFIATHNGKRRKLRPKTAPERVDIAVLRPHRVIIDQVQHVHFSPFSKAAETITAMCDQATEVIVLSATPLKDTGRDLYGPVRMVGATSETYKEFTNGILLQGKREVVRKKWAGWAAERLATCPCYIARPLYQQTLTTAPGPEIKESHVRTTDVLEAIREQFKREFKQDWKPWPRIKIVVAARTEWSIEQVARLLDGLGWHDGSKRHPDLWGLFYVVQNLSVRAGQDKCGKPVAISQFQTKHKIDVLIGPVELLSRGYNLQDADRLYIVDPSSDAECRKLATQMTQRGEHKTIHLTRFYHSNHAGLDTC